MLVHLTYIRYTKSMKDRCILCEGNVNNFVNLCYAIAMNKFSDRIYYMMHDDTNDEPYLFYIKGDRFSIQIDAGNSPKSFEMFEKIQEKENLDKPSLLVLTHWHWDHTFGLVSAKCPILATNKTQEYLKDVQSWKWTEEAMQERIKNKKDIPFCYEKMHVEYPDISKIKTRLADIVIDSKVSIDLGGISCELIPHDSPHTRDALFIYIPSEKVLIGGDGEYEDYYDNDSKYDLSRLRDFIAFVSSIDFEYYLHGHDDLYLTKQQLLDKMSSHLIF